MIGKASGEWRKVGDDDQHICIVTDREEMTNEYGPIIQTGRSFKEFKI